MQHHTKSDALETELTLALLLEHGGIAVARGPPTPAGIAIPPGGIGIPPGGGTAAAPPGGTVAVPPGPHGVTGGVHFNWVAVTLIQNGGRVVGGVRHVGPVLNRMVWMPP